MWISIKDELPDRDQRVLAYRPHMAQSDIGAVSVQWGWACIGLRSDVSHWMPLPEPPATEGEQ